MSDTEPWRIPHWLTPVCDDQPVSQREEAVVTVAQPAVDRRAVPGARSEQHVVGDAVELHEHDAWNVVRAADFDRRRARPAVRRSNHTSSSSAISDETTR